MEPLGIQQHYHARQILQLLATVLLQTQQTQVNAFNVYNLLIFHPACAIPVILNIQIVCSVMPVTATNAFLPIILCCNQTITAYLRFYQESLPQMPPNAFLVPFIVANTVEVNLTLTVISTYDVISAFSGTNCTTIPVLAAQSIPISRKIYVSALLAMMPIACTAILTNIHAINA